MCVLHSFFNLSQTQQLFAWAYTAFISFLWLQDKPRHREELAKGIWAIGGKFIQHTGQSDPLYPESTNLRDLLFILFWFSALLMLNEKTVYLSGQVQTGQTGLCPHSDTSPYGECSLLYPNLTNFCFNWKQIGRHVYIETGNCGQQQAEGEEYSCGCGLEKQSIKFDQIIVDKKSW